MLKRYPVNIYIETEPVGSDEVHSEAHTATIHLSVDGPVRRDATVSFPRCETEQAAIDGALEHLLTAISTTISG